MLAAESNSGHNRQSRNDASTQHRSGYEPSDTETEWHESPWNDAILKSQRTRLPKDPGRNPQVGARRQNTSPNRAREHTDEKTSNLRNNRTPPRLTEQRHQTSPYVGGKHEPRKKSNRTPPKFRPSMERFSRSLIKEKISRRSISTPKLRPHEKEHPSRVPAFHGTPVSKQAERDSTDFTNADSHVESYSQEVNELIANGKWPNSRKNEYICTSTESTGDIFFSRDCRAPLEKTSVKHNNIDTSNSHVDAENDGAVTQSDSSNLVTASQFVSVRTGISRTSTNTSYTTGQHSQISRSTTLSSQFNSGRFSGDSGKFGDVTGKLVGGVMKFTSNMHKAQNDAWLPCMTGKSCRKSRSSNSKAVDESESAFIQKAPVIEKIRLFWADKYRPRNLSGFTCHREQIQQLKQLVTSSTSFITTQVL